MADTLIYDPAIIGSMAATLAVNQGTRPEQAVDTARVAVRLYEAVMGEIARRAPEPIKFGQQAPKSRGETGGDHHFDPAQDPAPEGQPKGEATGEGVTIRREPSPAPSA